jgi:hypothetical protein
MIPWGRFSGDNGVSIFKREVTADNDVLGSDELEDVFFG